MSKNDTGSSIDEENIGDEGMYISKPIFKVTKSPGMLMSNSNSHRPNKQTMNELEDDIDEIDMQFEPDIKSKMKAMEFKVNRGLAGN
jgi:hypothetical protein